MVSLIRSPIRIYDRYQRSLLLREALTGRWRFIQVPKLRYCMRCCYQKPEEIDVLETLDQGVWAEYVFEIRFEKIQSVLIECS